MKQVGIKTYYYKGCQPFSWLPVGYQGNQASGNPVPDAHLAGQAPEHGCELCSTDSDFSCFPRQQGKNPLAND